MGLLSLLFGGKRKQRMKDMLERGALLIDVRSKAEYAQISIPGSKNIPLQNIGGEIAKIKKLNKPVIVYCASGMRSASAAAGMKAAGIEVVNGGGINAVMQIV